MANSWLRLWHDMPNDPKWRTISRVSKQSIPAVMAVYIHILVCASNATERGRTQSVCNEDIASALDMEVEQVDQIISAMQGRVLDGDMVSGWAKRQVEREDGSAERSKAWRESKKQAKTPEPNATERNRTQEERKRTPYTDTDTDTDKSLDATPTASPSVTPPKPVGKGTRLPEGWKLPKAWGDWATEEKPGWSAEDVRQCALRFSDFWHAKAGRDAVKLDWQATWRNWVRNETLKQPRASPAAQTFAGVL